MPRGFLFTRSEIVDCALALVREEGMDALTARGLAARLGTSSKPVFGLFRNMEEVQSEVVRAAGALLSERMRAEMASGQYPPYKASGMAYVRFAREERELFRLLFMRDRSGETDEDNSREQLRPLIEVICKNTGLSEERAYLLHLEMWVYVHGAATMLATSYLDWDMELVSRTMTDVYEGIKRRHIEEEGKAHGGHQNGGADKDV